MAPLPPRFLVYESINNAIITSDKLVATHICTMQVTTLVQITAPHNKLSICNVINITSAALT